jgi:lipopolysaccharide biosynthesis glycosyltransferase
MSARAPVILACGADEAFAMPMTVTLYSAISRLSRPTEVYIVDGGLSASSRDRIVRVLDRARPGTRVHFVAPALDSLRSSGLPVAGWGPMTYLRLLLPDALPSDVTHVLYLDSDLLVRADLASLWDERPLEHAIAAAPDFASPHVSGRAGVPNWRERGLRFDAPYVNAGVLLLNLDIWRESRLAEQIFIDVIEHRALNRFADQDSINAILCERCKPVDYRWNIPAYLEFDPILRGIESNPVLDRAVAGRRQLVAGGGIVHFVGPRKPWRRGLASKMQWQWLADLKASGWFADHPGQFEALAVELRIDALARAVIRAIRRRRPARSDLVASDLGGHSERWPGPAPTVEAQPAA